MNNIPIASFGGLVPDEQGIDSEIAGEQINLQGSDTSDSGAACVRDDRVLPAITASAAQSCAPLKFIDIVTSPPSADMDSKPCEVGPCSDSFVQSSSAIQDGQTISQVTNSDQRGPNDAESSTRVAQFSRLRSIDAGLVIERILLYGPELILTRGEVAAFIAERTMSQHDDQWTARNRVGVQLDRARKKGKFIKDGGIPSVGDKFTAGDAVNWANHRYPGKFDDLPNGTMVCLGAIVDTLAFGDSFNHERIPATYEEAVNIIRQLDRNMKQMRLELLLQAIERRNELARRFEGGISKTQK